MIEAMTLGKPVVAFDRPFSRDLFGGVPHITMAKSIRDYAAILHSLCTSQDLRAKLGNLLRTQAIVRFDVEKIAEEYLEVYNSLLRT
jgi:glycosyltransferase involved in cell wall biosynthesis